MLTLLAFVAAQAAAPAATWPTAEADVSLANFRFRSGETLPELRMHYTSLGRPHRNAAGEIDNAVMLLHGTGGTGKQFLQPQFAEELFGPGQPLDTHKYWIIMPDNIGHGASSKPSNGLKMKFPAYDYDDMVEAQRQMLGKLGVKRLRLIFGTSMGCMHAFVWGETHPDFAQALMPLACQPVEIAGVNRMWRQLSVDAIKADPAWQNGNYQSPPLQGLRTAVSFNAIVGVAASNWQAQYPTRDAAAAFAQQRVANSLKTVDANDYLYALESSRNYNPWPQLEKVTAPLMWLNSADDFINPRELPFPQQAVKRMKNAQFRLIPESADTRGHSTHTWAKFWKADLAALLARSAR